MLDAEFDFLLSDRIQKIKSIDNQYNLQSNAYISFSGGKDSTVLHYLMDEAIPGNVIPRVYINTGIEYRFILDYVKNLALKDNRIIVYNSGVNITEMLKTYGYPFKSKEHSVKLNMLKNGSKAVSVQKYFRMTEGGFAQCPLSLMYQTDDDFTLKVSDKCCHKLKKEPIKKWMKVNNKSITVTGMRKEEGGQRTSLNCILVDNGRLKKFHPLSVVSKDFEDTYIQKRNITLCKLYYPPYDFERTGCKGCPFAVDLENELYKMKRLLPQEYKQCQYIWKPVYDEYRKIGYRLKQYNLFDADF